MTEKLPKWLEAELDRIGVRQFPAEPDESEQMKPEVWKPSFDGEEPPF